ncbi:MAG: hypothetical protein S4CHLAM102_06280 [Chlamydiia bacterium]|nr:hypothetical protein [Chlamydiia bacterium]
MLEGTEGFLPQGGESEETFFSRVAHVKKALSDREKLDGLFARYLKKGGWLSAEEKQELFQKTREFFDFQIDYPPVFESKKRLPLWTCAVTWVCQLESGHRVPVIQKRPQGWLISMLFSLDELFAHEGLHAFRSSMNESKYEEILAYQTSKWSFRRFFGPLFESFYESMFFSICLAVAYLVGRILSLKGGLFLGGVLCGFFFFRLVLRQLRFKRARRELAKKVDRDVNPLWVLCRLTDREIDQLGGRKPEEFFEDLKKMSVKSLRHRTIFERYFHLTHPDKIS